MKLSYIDLLGDGERHEMAATITTEHSLSSYGQPVILIEDGEPLDGTSWILLNYAVVEATPEEVDLLRRWIETVYLASGLPTAAELGRKGGKSTSKSKSTASRENGKKGGRPRKAKPE